MNSHKIYELYDIFKMLNNNSIQSNYKNGNLYIDIDYTCMTEERIIHELFNANSLLRNRIIDSTKRISFEKTDNLIPTRYNLNEFISECKKIFGVVCYVTKKSKNDIIKIKQSMDENHLPKDIDVVHYDSLKNREFDVLYYIDINDLAFNEILEQNKIKYKEKSICFQMMPI